MVVHAWGMVAVRVRSQDGFRPLVRSTIRSQTFQGARFGKDGIISEVLVWIASLCAVVRMILGILELSSLVFISALEALQVLILYAISALLCQLVLILEMASMRYEMGKRSDPGLASSGSTLLPKAVLGHLRLDRIHNLKEGGA